MTNIATFGLRIDPTQAVGASHRIIIELRLLGEQIDRTAGKAAKSESAWSKWAKVIAGVAAAALAAVAALKAFSLATDLIQKSIESASRMEGFRNQWAFFLGSFDAAKKKMAELAAYANASPFDLPGVTTAALSLAKLKDTGLETAKGLEMVGDAAGAAQQPIEEVALRIAKMVNNLKRGGGAGDEASTLGEWMIFSPELVGKLKDLGDEAKNFPVLIEAIKKELTAAAGATGLMSTSWTGMMSTLDDKWDSFKTALGEPIMTALKPLLADLTAIVENITKEVVAMGPAIQNVASYIPATFRALKSDGGFQLMLTAAWDSFTDLMMRTFEGLTPTLISIFKRAGWELLNAFNALSSPTFWAGMTKAITAGITKAIEDAMPAASAFVKAMEIRAMAVQSVLKKSSPPSVSGNPESSMGSHTAFTGGSSAYSGGPSYQDQLELPTGAGENDSSLIPMRSAPEIVPFVMPEAETIASVKQWSDLFYKSFESVNNDIQKIADDNDKLVKEKKAQRDTAAALEANRPKVESEEDKKARLKSIIPGTDLTMQQGMDYQKSLLEKSFTPEEAYQAELAKIKSIHDALGTSEADYQKMIAYTTEQYTAEQAKRAEAAEAARIKEMSGLQKLMMEWGNLKKQVDDASVAIMNAIADNITNAVVAMVEGTKSAKDAFADMASGIINSILQIITRLIIQYALMSAMGMATGISTPSFGEFSTKALSGSVMHDGGIVGEGGSSRTVPASVFAGAQRYHTGGVVGADEVPIIAQRGEAVVSRDEYQEVKKRLASGASGGGGNPVNITIVNVSNPDEVKQQVGRDPDIVLNVLASQQNKVRQIMRTT